MIERVVTDVPLVWPRSKSLHEHYIKKKIINMRSYIHWDQATLFLSRTSLRMRRDASGHSGRHVVGVCGYEEETMKNKLWRANELNIVRTNTGHSLGVAAVAAHPSGIIAASSSLVSFVLVFDVDTNATISVLEAPPSEVWGMELTIIVAEQQFISACVKRLMKCVARIRKEL
ncbi:hypothetical protein HID58_094237 [Brassica napus]|uniref:Uncharacterized protein n=1 Tax=Brassica napus TaxID=3708 RepID=A0ABQ7X7Y2_BRANA|nr:hypothetical protein HID58_094237 [Brassica napus]